MKEIIFNTLIQPVNFLRAFFVLVGLFLATLFFSWISGYDRAIVALGIFAAFALSSLIYCFSVYKTRNGKILTNTQLELNKATSVANNNYEKCKEIEAELAKTQRNYSEKVANLESQIRVLAQENKSLATRFDSLATETNSHFLARTSQAAEIISLRELNNSFAAENNSLTSRCNSLSEKLAIASNKIISLEDNIKSLHEQLQVAALELESLREYKESAEKSHREEIERLKKEHQRTVNSLNGKLRVIKNQTVPAN